jgi:hypothetical protein
MNPRALARRASESIEFLALPTGAREEMLPEGAPPRDPTHVRILLIRLAREVGSEYARLYGVTLRTDAIAVERMQRHLSAQLDRAQNGEIDARALAREILRHGALLGEIFARSLDAVWTDLAGPQPAHWEMNLTPEIAVRPVDRVRRYLQHQNRERDLVALYMDLDRTRPRPVR